MNLQRIPLFLLLLVFSSTLYGQREKLKNKLKEQYQEGEYRHNRIQTSISSIVTGEYNLAWEHALSRQYSILLDLRARNDVKDFFKSDATAYTDLLESGDYNFSG